MRKYLAGVIAFVALTIIPLGLAAGLPSTVGEGRSTAASPGTSATSGRCSKAEATAVVKRLHLGGADFLPNPVWEVICGAFMGPGSQSMVVSLATGGASAPFGGWAVFRLAGGTWQLVMQRRDGARVSAAGSDIRETVSIMREGDSHCCPSGGTRSRIWHWNGTRFTASPWKQATKGEPEPKRPSRFDSPSRNIHCWMFDGGGDYRRGVGCYSDTPRRSVQMNADGRLKISGFPPSWCGCDEPDFPPLAYGRQITVGRFRCESLFTGMRCTVVQSGKGFLINRDGVSRVGS